MTCAPRTGQPCGGLAGNYPAAHDCHPFRHLDHSGGVGGGPGLHTLELVRHLGFATGRDDHGVPRGDGERSGVVDPNRAFADKASVTADHLDPCRFRPLDLGRIVVIRHEGIPALEHPTVVQARGRDAVNVCGGASDIERAQQGLAGHARVVRTLATQKMALHDDGREIGAFDRVLGRVLAHGSPTDDDDVHGEFLSLRLLRVGHEHLFLKCRCGVAGNQTPPHRVGSLLIIQKPTDN